MQSSSTFMRISGPVTKVKKSTVINDWENISYWKKPEQSKALENKFFLFQIELTVLGGVATLEKIFNIYPNLSLETVFAAIKLTRNYDVVMNISFS